jgi:hypothetical protein
MLTMTQIKNIKKMYYSKGEKVNEIVKITGHNYRTVIKYLKKDDFNQTVGIKEGNKRGRPRKIFFQFSLQPSFSPLPLLCHFFHPLKGGCPGFLVFFPSFLNTSWKLIFCGG